ncbi:DUF4062 domain-containing protein [Flavobacterium sp. PLA-1-15]|uniref:DUF4062 domain-containing protein n=1 Tax=Flavobacterium sp. PLA-1-15 TaxID=3380533 RepID=UPI003B7B1214
MPENISKYRIFLASPSDLTEERESIDAVVSELNFNYGNQNNIIIEVLKWETNSAPGISNTGVQDLINNDIPQYDLFIGLLWMRFGTPTKLFGSGTEEEFELAHLRFLKDPSSIQILFYFKNALPATFDDIDPDQLSKVKKFKSSLGEKNILFWDFDQNEDLCRFLRTHIPARIETLKKISVLPVAEVEKNEDILQIAEIIIEEEFGILDYQELIEDSFAISNHSLNIISEATRWVGNEMNKKTKEIDKLVAQNHNQPISFKVQRNIFVKTANAMNDFANRIEPEIPIYFSNFEKGIDSFSKLINIYKSDFENKKEEINELKVSLKNLIDNIPKTIESTNGFLITIESLPRMSKELNAARKNVTDKLRDLINRIEVSLSIASEVYKNI